MADLYDHVRLEQHPASTLATACKWRWDGYDTKHELRKHDGRHPRISHDQRPAHASSGIRLPTPPPQTMAAPDRVHAAQGLFPQVWQVMGSNHRRLSRRFTARRSYPRRVPLTSTYAVRGGFPRRCCPSCVRAYPKGSVARTGAKKPRTALLGAVTVNRPMATSPSSPEEAGRVCLMPRSSFWTRTATEQASHPARPERPHLGSGPLTAAFPVRWWTCGHPTLRTFPRSTACEHRSGPKG
jgi:hypothetical protein